MKTFFKQNDIKLQFRHPFPFSCIDNYISKSTLNFISPVQQNNKTPFYLLSTFATRCRLIFKHQLVPKNLINIFDFNSFNDTLIALKTFNILEDIFVKCKIQNIKQIIQEKHYKFHFNYNNNTTKLHTYFININTLTKNKISQLKYIEFKSLVPHIIAIIDHRQSFINTLINKAFSSFHREVLTFSAGWLTTNNNRIGGIVIYAPPLIAHNYTEFYNDEFMIIINSINTKESLIFIYIPCDNNNNKHRIDICLQALLSQIYILKQQQFSITIYGDLNVRTFQSGDSKNTLNRNNKYIQLFNNCTILNPYGIHTYPRFKSIIDYVLRISPFTQKHLHQVLISTNLISDHYGVFHTFNTQDIKQYIKKKWFIPNYKIAYIQTAFNKNDYRDNLFPSFNNFLHRHNLINSNISEIINFIFKQFHIYNICSQIQQCPKRNSVEKINIIYDSIMFIIMLIFINLDKIKILKHNFLSFYTNNPLTKDISLPNNISNDNLMLFIKKHKQTQLIDSLQTAYNDIQNINSTDRFHFWQLLRTLRQQESYDITLHDSITNLPISGPFNKIDKIIEWLKALYSPSYELITQEYFNTIQDKYTQILEHNNFPKIENINFDSINLKIIKSYINERVNKNKSCPKFEFFNWFIIQLLWKNTNILHKLFKWMFSLQSIPFNLLLRDIATLNKKLLHYKVNEQRYIHICVPIMSVYQRILTLPLNDYIDFHCEDSQLGGVRNARCDNVIQFNRICINNKGPKGTPLTIGSSDKLKAFDQPWRHLLCIIMAYTLPTNIFRILNIILTHSRGTVHINYVHGSPFKIITGTGQGTSQGGPLYTLYQSNFWIFFDFFLNNNLINRLPVPTWNPSSILYNGLNPTLRPLALTAPDPPASINILQVYNSNEFQISLYGEKFNRDSYMDDTTLYTNKLSSLIRFIHITDFGQNLYMLPYNPLKFDILHIPNYSKKENNINMNFHGHLLTLTDSIKIVGFYINRYNSLKHQLLHIEKKVSLFLHTIEQNGFYLHTINIEYLTLTNNIYILPIIIYGLQCPIRITKSEHDKLLQLSSQIYKYNFNDWGNIPYVILYKCCNWESPIAHIWKNSLLYIWHIQNKLPNNRKHYRIIKSDFKQLSIDISNNKLESSKSSFKYTYEISKLLNIQQYFFNLNNTSKYTFTKLIKSAINHYWNTFYTNKYNSNQSYRILNHFLSSVPNDSNQHTYILSNLLHHFSTTKEHKYNKIILTTLLGNSQYNNLLIKYSNINEPQCPICDIILTTHIWLHFKWFCKNNHVITLRSLYTFDDLYTFLEFIYSLYYVFDCFKLQI